VGMQRPDFSPPPANIDEAIQETIYRSPAAAKEIAAKLGTSPSSLSRYAADGGPQRGDLTVRQLVPLLHATRSNGSGPNLAILDFLDAHFGRIAISIPAHDIDDASLVRDVASAHKALGDVIATALAARESGQTVSAADRQEFAARLQRLISAASRLLAAAGIVLSASGCFLNLIA